MRGHIKAGGLPKRLTLRLIQNFCSTKVFKLAKEYVDQGLVDDIAVQKDGTLTGTVFGMYARYVPELMGMMMLSDMSIEQPVTDRRAGVSLRTGKWFCSCPYARVGICSHVAALLVSAAKLKAVLPGGGLPARGKSGERTALPYRREVDRILDRASDPESADADLEDFLELAAACYTEGDIEEALLVCIGASESLLSGLEYSAYSEHFMMFPEIPLERVRPSDREPEGMDAVRVDKFCHALRMAMRISNGKIPHEKRAPCMAALHRLYLKTNPWGPSRLYLFILIVLSKNDKDKEFLRKLHDPAVPYGTPDPREDPVGFEAVMELAGRQAAIYSDLKDYSLLASYAGRYRNDPGAWARYVMCLRRMGHDSTAVEEEGRRLFPDAGVWRAK